MKSFPYPLRFTIPLLLFIIIVSFGTYHLKSEVKHATANYEEEVRRRVVVEGTQLSCMLMRLYHFGKLEEAENMLIKGQSSYGFRLAFLFDEKNRIIISSDDIFKGAGLSQSPAAEMADILEKTREFSSSYYRFSDDRMVIKSVYPVHLVEPGEDMSSRKTGVLYIEHDLTQGKKLAYMDALQSFYNLMTVLIAVCFLAWGFLAFTLTRRANRLLEASKRFARGDSEVRADLKGSDELAHLASAFDHMVQSINANTKALKESEERYRRLVEGLREHFLYSRNTNGVFTYTSPTITRVLGYSPEEFKSHFTDYLTDNRVNRDVLRINELGINGEPLPSYEVEAFHRDGSRKWLHISENPVSDKNGKVIAIEGIAQDITEKKKAEEELRKAKEKAEEATKLKDKFVSLVVHDLKSPLSSLLIALEFIHTDKEVPVPPEHKETLSLALKSGENMIGIIKELLDINRLQTGMIAPNLTTIDVCDLATSVVEDTKYLAEKKGIEIVNEVLPETKFSADAMLYTQVIQNLVSNAIKFCRKGDRITLFIPEGKSTTLAVMDTGIGVSEYILPNIFKYEEKTTTKGTSGETGTGLGLPLSYEIMEAHGGSLSVESVKGKGSVFYAHLPAAGEDEEVTEYQLMENKRLGHEIRI